MALKDWKYTTNKSIKNELEQEGNKIDSVWRCNGRNVFITKPQKPYQKEYIVGEKFDSQMDEPRLIGKAKTLTEAKRKALLFMQNH